MSRGPRATIGKADIYAWIGGLSAGAARPAADGVEPEDANQQEVDDGIRPLIPREEAQESALLQQIAQNLWQRLVEVGDADKDDGEQAHDERGDQPRAQRCIPEDRDLQRNEHRAEPEEQQPRLAERLRLGVAEVAGERDDGDAGEAQTKNDPERILDEKCSLLLIIEIRDRLLGALC